MKVLVIGSGGREHAIAWRLAQSPEVSKVYVSPGNPGTAQEPKCENLHASNFASLINFVKLKDVAFTIVGPEAPLSNGIVNQFREANLPIFGPTQEAAQLESSKDFAKRFMTKFNIPTAKFQTFEGNQVEAAHAYVNQQGAPIVIKADGLAAGKGVVVAMTLEQAHEAIDDILGGCFGDAGSRIVIEEFLEGEEISFMVMCDGKNILPLATSQDHKRLLDGDEGPNTGGMGAYSPAPLMTPELHAQVMKEVINPTIAGMRKLGFDYTGFLYAGLMVNTKVSPASIKVVEFNCRLGDPETQPIMMRIQSDFAQVVLAATKQKLNKCEIQWDERYAVGVVLASANYPNQPKVGDVITGINDTENHKTFHAGTSLNEQGQCVTSSGRVLCTVAYGKTIDEAQKSAYVALSPIYFTGMQYRRDIGWRALSKNND